MVSSHNRRISLSVFFSLRGQNVVAVPENDSELVASGKELVIRHLVELHFGAARSAKDAEERVCIVSATITSLRGVPRPCL